MIFSCTNPLKEIRHVSALHMNLCSEHIKLLLHHSACCIPQTCPRYQSSVATFPYSPNDILSGMSYNSLIFHSHMKYAAMLGFSCFTGGHLICNRKVWWIYQQSINFLTEIMFFPDCHCSIIAHCASERHHSCWSNPQKAPKHKQISTLYMKDFLSAPWRIIWQWPFLLFLVNFVDFS